MRPLLILLVLASLAYSFTWQSITSGNYPYVSVDMNYHNQPFAASNDTLYVATSGGLLIRTPTGDRMWTVVDGYLTSNIITTITPSASGGVWVGCQDRSVARLNPQTNRGEIFNPFRNDIDITELQVMEEYNGELLISTNAGITRLNYNSQLQQWVVKETYHDLGDIGHNPLVYGMQVIHDTLWVSTQHGLTYGIWNSPLLISPSGWHKIAGLGSSETYEVTSVRDTTFVANISGCYYLAGETPIQIRSALTRHLGVWNDTLITVSGDGIQAVYDGRQISARRDAGYFVVTPTSIYTYFAESDTNASEFATLTRSVGHWLYDNANTPIYPGLQAATRRSDGTLVVTCNGDYARGVNEFDGQHWRFRNRFTELGQQNFFSLDALALAADANNNVWVGSLSNGIAVFYPDSMQYFDQTAATGAHLSRLPDYDISPVPAIGFLSNGRVVFLNQQSSDHTKSLFVLPDGAGVRPGWQNGTWTHIGQSSPLAVDITYSNRLAVDAWDRVWFASTFVSQRLGVYDFNGTIENTSDDIYRTFGTESGLPADLSVASMAFGADQTLYLAMSGQLYYGHIGESLTGTTFYQLQLPLTATSANVICADAVGQIWVGTTNGLALLSADGQNWVTVFHAATQDVPSGLATDNIDGLQFLPSTGELFVENAGGISLLQTPYRQSGQNLGSITPAPNPFINDGSSIMKFGESGLVTNADVRIFTPSGLLVRRLGFLEAASNGWNGRNESGQRVATGVYFLIVNSPDGKIARGKVAVITP